MSDSQTAIPVPSQPVRLASGSQRGKDERRFLENRRKTECGESKLSGRALIVGVLRRGWACLAGFALLFLAASTCCAENSPWLDGHWTGTLDVSVKLRLVFHVESKDGQRVATLDSPDQGAVGIPIDRVEVEGRTVRFELSKVRGSYEGQVSEDKKVIEGKWKQNGATFDLTLRHSREIEAPKRPQTPQKPYPYDENEVVVEHLDGKVRLAGTLTVPRGAGPFPAVVLISGSGPQNRDEELMQHRPFLVLADHLTRCGVAVLRCDDRGVGASTGDFAKADSRDFARDAEAAVDFLAKSDRIDDTKIGLIGHSEGGLIAPMVANRSSRVAFVVLLAGPAVTGEEIMYRQAELIGEASGSPLLARVLNRSLQQQLFEAVKSTDSPEALEDKVRSTLKLSKPADGEKDPQKNASQAAMEGQLQMIKTPWFRFFLTYDPRPELEKLRVPVLVLNGEKDLQVDPKQNLPVMEAALKAGDNQHARVRQMPGLNHLFQRCETGNPGEYGTIEETINEAALKEISEWIVALASR